MTTSNITDPRAIDGKFNGPEAHFEVVVVGAGPAGLAAALTAAEAGRQVLLVDEHPVPGAQVGTDVPLWFGGRATPALQNRARMLEQVFLAEPLLEQAFDRGVEVRLGTQVWGLYRNRANLGALPEAMLGLADDERSSMVGFDTLILATGTRDFAVAFPGWDQPGVMGAVAFHALVARYDAFAGQRLVIVGSGELALDTALLAHERGLAVAALIEVRDSVQGSAAKAAQVAALGIPVRLGTTLFGAEAAIDGVTGARIGPVGGAVSETLACDTICMAIDSVPAIELADIAGAQVVTDGGHGGHVVAGAGEVLPGIWLAGSVTGVEGSREDAAASGRAVARAALGLGTVPERASPEFDRLAYRAEWTRALVAVTPEEVHVCLCEEVSRADLIGVQPPNYLERGDKLKARSLETLLEDGPPDQEQIKRLTRACMGACQARRCREQVSLLLAMGANCAPDKAPRAAWRAPVRPIPLALLADWQESEAMRAGWDVWFGIETQWIPYRDIGTDRERQHREVLGGNMHL